MTWAPWGKYHGPQGAKKKIKEYSIFPSTKAATLLWFGVMIDINHPHTAVVNMPHMLKNVDPRSLHLNKEGFFCLSNQESQLDLVWYGDRY